MSYLSSTEEGESISALLSIERDLYDYRADNERLLQKKHESLSALSPKVVSIYNSMESTVDKCIEDGSVHIAIRHAVINNNLLKVAILLRVSGNTDTVDSKGRGLIHLCSTADMVKLLIAYGVNLYQRAMSGNTALHSVGHVDAAKELIAQGLSVQSQNNSQSTPLHYSLDPRVTRIFLDAGADPNQVNYYGHTPLHLVASRGIWEVVYLLLVYGCNVDTVGSDGRTAVALAKEVETCVLRQGSHSSSVPAREFIRLSKSIELMQYWKNSCHPGRSLRETSRLVTHHFAWKAQALLSRDPMHALQYSTGLPEDIINVIIVEFVGVFGGSHHSYREMSMASIRQLARERATPSKYKMPEVLLYLACAVAGIAVYVALLAHQSWYVNSWQ